MSSRGFSQETCERTRRHLDAYLSNELMVETNLEVLKHLEGCNDCSAALESRMRVRNALRKAVEQEIVPVGLRGRIQARLRGGEARRGEVPFWNRWAMVAAMASLVCVAGGGVYRAWIQRHSSGLTQLTAAILKIGLGDHIHCAIDSQFSKQHYTREEMSSKLGPEYSGLVLLAKDKVPPEYDVVVAHQCTFNGRRFVHLILKNQETVISLAITKKEGESFPRDELQAALKVSGVPLYKTRAQSMEVAGFETRDYLGFVVSDLGESQNLQIASSLVPAVRDFLAKLEG
jgi:anti-sigma factor (TIGR02949 family)